MLKEERKKANEGSTYRAGKFLNFKKWTDFLSLALARYIVYYFKDL